MARTFDARHSSFETDFAACLAEQLDLVFADLSMYSHTAVFDESVSQRFLRESQIAPTIRYFGLGPR